MITGILQSKDILRHPFIVISTYGIRRFFRLLVMALSNRPHKFIEEVTIVGQRPNRPH